MTSQTIETFIAAQKQKSELNEPFALESPQLLELNLRSTVFAKVGSMVSYQGEVSFTRESMLSRGWKQFFLSLFTSEGIKLMNANGVGRVYLADQGKRIQILNLSNETIFVNGNDILAFEPTIHSKITLMRSVGAALGGGMFNICLTGSGRVAITSHHVPLAMVVIPSMPVYTDPKATVAWSSGLDVDIHTDVQLKTLFGRGSGESIQLKFSGRGWVLVQPFEELPITGQRR